MERLARDTNDYNPKIIAGDTNAWTEDWGSRETIARGRVLFEALSELNLVLVNLDASSVSKKGKWGR